MSTHPPADADLVLVVDFGAQYAQLIARRVRECSVYSEVVPHTITAEEIRERAPKAVILSGGPSSVYADGAPQISAGFFDTGVPTFGICYGFQAMAAALGGTVARTGTSEFGRTALDVVEPGVLFGGLPSAQAVWMSHNDAVSSAPPGFAVTASTPQTPVAAFEDTARGLYGVQFHPEVLHSEHGQKVLSAFLDAAGCRRTWTMVNIVEEQVERIRAQVGDKEVVCGLSGGVDSAVAAALVHRAVGDQLTCVFVDHGLLRKGEAEQVEQDFVASTGVKLRVAKVADQFLPRWPASPTPRPSARRSGASSSGCSRPRRARSRSGGDVEFLVQGTLYPDVVESGGGAGTSNIKSHHNVGGLPDDLQFALVEPLRMLFKDEVRAVGLELGLPEAIVWRQPFPGPGLGIRIIGEVTQERLDLLREADAIAREELTRGRAGPGRVAVPGGAARRRPLGRRPGRRAHLRPPRRAAAGVVGGRDDRRLVAHPLRRAGDDLDPHHERGARGEPGGAGRDEQAAGHHRVGVGRRLAALLLAGPLLCGGCSVEPRGTAAPGLRSGSLRTSTRSGRTRSAGDGVTVAAPGPGRG